MMELVTIARSTLLRARCNWKQDAHWREVGTILLWFILKKGKYKHYKRLSNIVRGQPSWDSPQQLSKWQTKPGSHIYALVNISTSWTYVGLIHNRQPAARWHEHNRNMKIGNGMKYHRMKGLGLEKWYMIPLAEFNSAVVSSRLHKIEQKYIRMFPDSLNNLRSRWHKRQVPERQRKVKVLLQKDEQANRRHENDIKLRGPTQEATKDQGPTALLMRQAAAGMPFDYHCPYYCKWAEAISEQGEELTLQEAVHQEVVLLNLTSACNMIPIKRLYGTSVVLIYRLAWCKRGKIRVTADAEVMHLKRALKQGGWIIMKMVEKCHTPLHDDELLQEMQTRVRQSTKYWHQLSTLTELWRMCGRLGRMQVDADRKRAKLHITAALRKKGLLTNPFSPLIVKIPKESSILKREVKRCIRSQLYASTLPRRIASGIRIRIVEERAPTAIDILSNFKQHICKMSEGTPA